MRAETDDPNMAWYLRISRERGVTPRCPFATVESCPRYFHSLSLLGEAGSTKIPPEEDKRLEEFWKKSDLLPRTREQDTALAGTSSKWTSYSEFCPEVIFNRYGLFASHLADYADSIDREVAQEQLAQRGVPGTNWRWRWAWVQPMHFTECPLYSPLAHRRQSAERTSRLQSGEAPEELLKLNPGIWGISLNLKEALRRLRVWWVRRSRRDAS